MLSNTYENKLRWKKADVRLFFQVGEELDEGIANKQLVGAAARQLRALADSVEANPGQFIDHLKDYDAEEETDKHGA